MRYEFDCYFIFVICRLLDILYILFILLLSRINFDFNILVLYFLFCRYSGNKKFDIFFLLLVGDLLEIKGGVDIFVWFKVFSRNGENKFNIFVV